MYSGYTFVLSVCVFPGNRTHNLCAANTMLYHWAIGTVVVAFGVLCRAFPSCFIHFSPSPSALEGQERFGNMTRVYYREAMGAFIVFDVSRPTTFEAVSKWKEDLDSKLILSNGQSIATVLLANKCDQNRDFLTNNSLKMDQYCKENGFVGWFETSAKVRRNILVWL